MLWKATATAEKEMQNMKHVWKRYLIVTAMTVVLGLSAGCGSAVEDTNNNQNNTQDENTPDGNENKNNNGTSPDTNTDMNNDGTNGTNNNMNGATSGEGTVDENGNRLEHGQLLVHHSLSGESKNGMPLFFTPMFMKMYVERVCQGR